MSSEIAIKVENLSKCYQIYDQPRDRLKQFVLPRLQLLAGQPPKQYYREFWALKDVSFEVKKGEAVGIIGRNGSGKSTLLQLICETLSPTRGIVSSNGRIAALLELGSGFNPEFTGRENIYLNGAIHGIEKNMIDEIFPSIEKFADIGDFLEQPVKTYSSGMFVRLAFAVQMHLEPEILIIDEALSVGDQFFQAKCYAAIRQMMDCGTTVLFVSHSAATVKALCPRAILLSQGKLVSDGKASQVLDQYFVLGARETNTAALGDTQSNATQASPKIQQPVQIVSNLQPPFERRVSHRVGTGQAKFVECRVLADSVETTVVETGATLCVQAVLSALEDCPYEGEIGLVISTTEGVELFAVNSFFQGIHVPPIKKGETCLLEFEFVSPLSSGAKYRIDLGYRMPVQGEYVDKAFAAAGFNVVNQAEKFVPLLFDVPGTIRIRSIA